MEKFIPYEKLSKKKQRELNRERRGSWGVVNPVSRRVESAKVYNRRKAKQGDPDALPSFFYENANQMSAAAAYML